MHQTSLFHPAMEWENECHVISLRWKDFSPVLLCRSLDEKNKLKEYPLLERIEIHVFNEKTCIGRWENDQYIPCPDQARVIRFNRCDACAKDIIPDQSCIFEPRCEGYSCIVDGERIEFCSRHHAVYLAYYGTKPKVGMSSEGRVRERCIEQGADAYSIIMRTNNRFEARHRERKISKALSIRQSFSTGEILRMTTSPVNYREIEKEFMGMRIRLREIAGMEPEELNLLRDYPISLPIRSVPRETTTPGLHIGRIVGIKGRFLYYVSGGLSALNISDIQSRRIRFNAFP
ncbi:MAG: DUF2797 domain-containing protein [Thermoplasmata archaeon]|nr:DUF2797 domain-containing protein [Thermoplasmata archaeon]